MNGFKNLNLLPSLLETLKEKEISKPTKIQELVIPKLLQGQSIVAVSETGSGKTIAFALPILQILKSFEDEGLKVTESSKPRAAIIVPTRDLGEQVTRVFKSFTHTTRLRVRSVLGGTEFRVTKKNVSGPFEILIATPGQLNKLLDRDLVNLNDVCFLVFDEADQMLDHGFLPDANRIAKACAYDRQMALFSATVSPAVQALMTKLFSDAEVIRTSGSQKLVPTLTTNNKTVDNGKRFPLLLSILEKKVAGGTLIFTNTRAQCDVLFEALKKAGHKCLIYRGEMDKAERRNNLKQFREGKFDLLISTDLAARGLDVDHISRVINYHLPREHEVYLHRVGRTARAGRSGLVINLVTERDLTVIESLSRVKT